MTATMGFDIFEGERSISRLFILKVKASSWVILVLMYMRLETLLIMRSQFSRTEDGVFLFFIAFGHR